MAEDQKAYRVLARKYRPQNFGDLIGQEALVRTLSNAITSGRIAQAYMLTGIRGVGKTTTARIIAKALNYKDGPTTSPTDDCDICRAITEDRHPDVMEMDAASRTGIDDIREIIDGVRYAPTEARYKVYIIDEVHMLSKQAFNALLKTLEEPPERVVFIFATTEIRKVPITILSRCQRFDLRRIDMPTLSAHYKHIAGLEQVEIEDDAADMIARAADGSVRDGLSLLDQAIALAQGKVTSEQVRSMLGLADQAGSLILLKHALCGQMPETLQKLTDLYSVGVDPAVLLQDLLDCVHILTRLRVAPESAGLLALSPDLKEEFQSLAHQFSMPTLAKAWQLLLKGLSEVQTAQRPQIAAEMVMIRLCYTADLPDPAELLKQLKDGTLAPSTPPAPSAPPDGGGQTAYARTGNGTVETYAEAVSVEQMQVASPKTLEDVVALLNQGGKFQIASLVKRYVRLVKMSEGKLECNLSDAPQSLSTDLTQALRAVTGVRWLIIVSSAEGQPTLAEREATLRHAEIDLAKTNPLVAEILQMFPGADITRIYDEE